MAPEDVASNLAVAEILIAALAQAESSAIESLQEFVGVDDCILDLEELFGVIKTASRSQTRLKKEIAKYRPVSEIQKAQGFIDHAEEILEALGS